MRIAVVLMIALAVGLTPLTALAFFRGFSDRLVILEPAACPVAPIWHRPLRSI